MTRKTLAAWLGLTLISSVAVLAVANDPTPPVIPPASPDSVQIPGEPVPILNKIPVINRNTKQDIIPVAFNDNAREQTPMPQLKNPPPTPVQSKTNSSKLNTGISLEWVAPQTIRLNKPNNFSLKIQNTNQQTAQNVVVQVRLPDGVKAQDIAPEAKTEKGILYWELGNIDGLQSQLINLKLSSSKKNDMTCQAWVTSTGTAGVKVAVREPKLEVAIDAPKEVVLGDPIHVNYLVKNTGDDQLEPTTVKLANDLNVNTPFHMKNSSLIAGEIAKCETSYATKEGGVRKYEIIAESEGGQKAKAVATVKVLVPKLTVSVTGPAERQVGRKATYTVTVNNGGDVALKDVNVSETFPSEFRYVSSDLANTNEKGKILWQIGELIPGQSKVFSYEALAICPGPANHQVKAVGSRNTNALANAKTVVDGVPAMRMEVVDTVDPIEKGGETTYEIKLVNTGTMADKNVQLECILPAELTYVSADGPTKHASQNINNQTVIKFEPISELTPKKEMSYKIQVKAVGSGDIRFKAMLTSKYLTKPVTKEESTRIFGE